MTRVSPVCMPVENYLVTVFTAVERIVYACTYEQFI